MPVAEQMRATLEPMFGRHETFAPRYGWFKKTADGISDDRRIFAAEDATLRLGVGKNMVRSMRFWSGAAAIVTPRRPERNEALKLTDFGAMLLTDRGWDPYLELPASLWLLHWRMLSPGCQLPVWWFAFNDFAQADFSVAGLAKLAHEAVTVVYGIKEPAESSVKRDAECLVHTYLRRGHDRAGIDDALACPFRTLGLVEQEPGRSGMYRFRVGPKPNLPPEIVAYAAVNFSLRQSSTSRSIALGRLLRDAGSPGKVFKLDEDSLIAALTQVARSREDLQFTDTAGVSALQISGDAPAIAVDLLNQYYGAVTGSKSRLKSLRELNDLIGAAEAPRATGPRGRRRSHGST